MLRLAGLDEPAHGPPEGCRSTPCGPRLRGQHPLRPAGGLRSTSPRARDPPRSGTTGRWPSRNSSTSSGRCCWRAASPSPLGGRRGKGRQVERLPRNAVLTMLVVLTLASLSWSVYATVESPSSAYFSTLTGPGSWGRRPGGVGTADVRTPPHPVQPRGDGGHGRGDARDRLHRDHGRDSVPGDRGRAAGGRHRDAHLVRRAADSSGERTVSSNVLAVPPMRIIGDWSYSLYLWHWPAFILLPVRARPGDDTVREVPRGPCVITLSAYTYRFVEMPFRAGRPARRPGDGRWCSTRPAPSSWSPRRASPGGRPLPGGEHGDTPPITVAGAPDRRGLARQHRGRWCARRSTAAQGQARGAEQPHSRPAQPARLDRRCRGLRLRGQRPASCARTATAAALSW